jgi:hypothetical protein
LQLWIIGLSGCLVPLVLVFLVDPWAVRQSVAGGLMALSWVAAKAATRPRAFFFYALVRAAA